MRHALCRPISALPNSPPGLGHLEFVHVLVARRHRGVGAGQHLVVIDVEQPQPALLAERQADHAAELDQLRLAEVLVHAVPERVVGVEVPGDRFGIGQRRLLALVVIWWTSRN